MANGGDTVQGFEQAHVQFSTRRLLTLNLTKTTPLTYRAQHLYIACRKTKCLASGLIVTT